MENRFELLPGRWIRKDAFAEFGAIEAVIRSDDFRTESGLDFLKRRLSRLDQFTSEKISVDDREATFPEQPGRGGLSHSDSARQPQKNHNAGGIGGGGARCA